MLAGSKLIVVRYCLVWAWLVHNLMLLGLIGMVFPPHQLCNYGLSVQIFAECNGTIE